MKQLIAVGLLGACAYLAAAGTAPVGAWNFEKVEGSKVKACIGPDGKIVNLGKNARIVPGRSGGNALYIGGGKVVHASSPKSGIKISKYNYRTPYKAVSVLYD